MSAPIQTNGRTSRVPSRMPRVDTSGNTRIPILMEMVGALSRAKEPRDVLRAFSEGLEKLDGPRGYVSLSTRGLPAGAYRITRMLLGSSPQSIETADPWRTASALPIHRGGFFGDLIQEAYPEIFHDVFLRDDPVVGDALAAYGSVMAIPLFDDGEPLNWAVMLRESADGFSVEDLEDAILRANLVGATVRNTLAARDLRTAHATIRREVEQIANIQRALLPRSMPSIPGVAVSASYETHDQAGGDYYDFFPLGRDPHAGSASAGDEAWRGPWGLLIADAAGHGPAAAVMMAMLHAILHAYPTVPEHPGVVLEHANEHLCRKGIDSSFVTAIFAIYDPVTRGLRYARAGHPPALLKVQGSGGAVSRLDAVGSVPLGILPGVSYEDAEITLEVGQTVVLYTDGITESMSPDKEMFEVEGIERALHLCTGDPDCVQGSITKALRAHEETMRPNDDQTIVALKVVGEDRG